MPPLAIAAIVILSVIAAVSLYVLAQVGEAYSR